MDNSEANVDTGADFAEAVFNDEPIQPVESDSAAKPLESWDDIPEEPSSEAINEESDSDSKSVSDDTNSQDAEQSLEQEANSADQDQQQDNDEEASDSSTDEQESNEDNTLEIPEEVLSKLQERGLSVSEKGEIGKVVKIDGEEQFVPLDELGNDYSGQQAIQKRFTELDRENKQFKQEVETVNNYVNTFRERMQSGGPEDAMKYLGELAGIPPYQIERQMMQSLMPKIQELSQMTPHELQAKYAQEENEYLKQSLESEREQVSAQQAQQELEQEIASVREAHQIEESEWDEALEVLREHEAEIRAANPDTVINAEFVADFIRGERAYNSSVQALEAANVNPSENGDLAEQLQDIAYRNPDFTQEDLVELVNSARQNAVESKVSKGLGERVEKHGQKAKPKQETKQQSSPEETSYLDDLFFG
jgi:hypothetical protein